MRFVFVLMVSVWLVGCSGSTTTTDTHDTSPSTPSQVRLEAYFSRTSGPYRGGIDEQIVADIDSATQSVHIAIYEITNDHIRDALMAAHDRHIDVRIMTDNTKANSDDMVVLRNAGIEIHYDDDNGLMHDKFLIIDHRIVWTGSSNYTYYGFYRNNENDLRIDDPSIAAAYEEQFGELCSGAHRHHPYTIHNVEIYFSPDDDFRTRLISAIDHATSSIELMVFAFTDRSIADALIRAYKRGVVIQCVLDESFTTHDTHAQYDYLRGAGIDVTLDHNPYKLHNKVLLIDQNIVITGSYNLTNSANIINDENSLLIHSASLYDTYHHEFEQVK